MIVISGALVLVALVLLIIGLVSTSLPFVYASIAVSVVSFVFLLIGILQRRGEALPEGAAVADGADGSRYPPTGDLEGVTAIIPAGSRAGTDPPAAAEQDAPVSGSVLVVAGRPRYHVAGCRYLTGKQADTLDVQSARDEGFTACGVCKPDAVLAEQAEVRAPEPAEEPAATVPDPVSAARRTTRAAPTTEPGRTPAAARSAAKSPAKSAAKKAPVKTAAAARPAAKSVEKATKSPANAGGTAAGRTAGRTAGKAPSKPPSKAAAAAAASTPAGASAARRTGTVVVIPDRGKFHTPECRFVRGVGGTEELTRAQATRQGYDACGVCKP